MDWLRAGLLVMCWLGLTNCGLVWVGLYVFARGLATGLGCLLCAGLGWLSVGCSGLVCMDWLWAGHWLGLLVVCWPGLAMCGLAGHWSGLLVMCWLGLAGCGSVWVGLYGLGPGCLLCAGLGWPCAGLSGLPCVFCM